MDKGGRMGDSGRRMSKEIPAQRIVAIVGRPNVGKSALFNRLVRRRLAIVHAEEGVTRDRLAAPAEWLGQRFEVVDTGGLALMDRAKTGDDIARATADQVKVAMEDAAAVILVTDLKAGLQPLDIEVARLLRKAGRPAVVADLRRQVFAVPGAGDHGQGEAHRDALRQPRQRLFDGLDGFAPEFDDEFGDA